MLSERGRERALGVRFFEAEPAQAAEDFFADACEAGARAVDGSTVRAAVGVVNTERGTGFAAQVQATRVNAAVVGAANGDEVVGVVGAAIGNGHDVVHVNVEGVAATRDLATVLVALEDAAADGCWDGS